MAMRVIVEADGYKVTQTLSGVIVLVRANGSTFERDSVYEAIRATPDPTRAKLFELWRLLPPGGK